MPELATSVSHLALTALLAYLLGSVPFGIVMARLFGLGDPRAVGSGNIGATNVLRMGSKPAALLTLIGDAGKGAAAVLAARAALGEDAAQVAGLAAFLGHGFPVYLRFKGGKGVATFLGTLLAVSPPLGLAACATWLAAALATRISSVGALAAAAAAPLWAAWFRPDAWVFAALIGATVIAWHRANIARLRAGTEPRIGRKKD